MTNPIDLRNDILQLGINQAVFANISGYDMPNKLDRTIYPVLITNKDPYINVVANDTYYYSGGQPPPVKFYTTPTDRDFFLVNRTLMFTNLHNPIAPGNPINVNLQVTLPDGSVVYILTISGLDNKDSDNIIIEGHDPIKLKRGSDIKLIFNAGGTANLSTTITGYTADSNIY